MAKQQRDNEVTVRLHPVIWRHVDVLVASGFYGVSRAKAIEQLALESIRQHICNGGLDALEKHTRERQNRTG